MAEQYAADLDPDHTRRLRRDPVAAVREHVGPALAAGIDPTGPAADPVVAAVTARYAEFSGRPDDADLRRRLLTRLETANEPRRELYFQLLSVINCWPALENLTPALDWSIRALRARLAI